MSISGYKIIRKIAFLALLLLPFVAMSKKKKHTSYAPKTFPVSRWREVKRMRLKDSTNLAYQDTIHIEFLLKKKYIWQRTKGFIYKGAYDVEMNELSLGMVSLTIVQRRAGKMILKDDSTAYYFVQDPNLPTLADKKIVAGKVEEPPKPVNSVDQMVGHWSEYKRTNAKELNLVDYNRVIKMIDITGGSTDNTLGSVYAANDPINAASWKIKSFQDHQLILTGKDTRTLTVIKCESNELVLQENDMTYYFKQFK